VTNGFGDWFDELLDDAGAPKGPNSGNGTTDGAANNANGGTEPPSPLIFINTNDWDGQEPPPRQWAVEDRIPSGQTTLFTGEGASGKSTLAYQEAFAHALACDWLLTSPSPGPAIFVDAEDGADELWRRGKNIASHYQSTFEDARRGGLHLMSLVGKDALLATATRSGKIEATALYKQLLEAAGDIKPKLIAIASLANIYAGNEIDRAQVQQFISLTTRLAMLAEGAVVIIGHPSLTGINSDTGLSGNTQWHNAVRAWIYLKSVKPEGGEQPDTDLREIVFKKNNYGPISASIILRYQNGLYLPVPGVQSLDQAAREMTAQEVFLAVLNRFQSENRIVCQKSGTSYAPALFAKEEEARRAGLNSKNLEEAMRQLFRTGKIFNEPYGRPSRPHYRIIVK
jgi:RecA-family ATPase